MKHWMPPAEVTMPQPRRIAVEQVYYFFNYKPQATPSALRDFGVRPRVQLSELEFLDE